MRIRGRATLTGHVTERNLDDTRYGHLILLGLRVRLTEGVPEVRAGDVVVVQACLDEYMHWSGRVSEVLCSVPDGPGARVVT